MTRALGVLFSLVCLGAAVATMVWTHRVLGGDPRVFLQPEALAVVIGGTAAALIVSFPAGSRHGAIAALVGLVRRPAPPADDLVATFVTLAYTARRQGWSAIEGEIARMKDPFLARALTLTTSGLGAAVVRDTLDVESRVAAEHDEEHAQVLDAAGRYAPTLGLLGALLALLRAAQLAPWSAAMTAAIGAAVVSVVYGIGLSNLICQPLAARLRARARATARCRDLTIRGVLALGDGAAPSVVEERLSGYLSRGRSPLADVA
jgi:chemotaxis protein MotA